jgi:hypothetical protein
VAYRSAAQAVGFIFRVLLNFVINPGDVLADMMWGNHVPLDEEEVEETQFFFRCQGCLFGDLYDH